MKSPKSSSLAMAMVIIGTVVVLGTQAEARSASESSPSKIVIGKVSQVEGEFQMAKDPKAKTQSTSWTSPMSSRIKQVKRCVSNSAMIPKSGRGSIQGTRSKPRSHPKAKPSRSHDSNHKWHVGDRYAHSRTEGSRTECLSRTMARIQNWRRSS